MCGRFALSISPSVLAKLFGLDEIPDLPPRYNIAPGQSIAAVLSHPEGNIRVLKMLRWGLVPPWAKDPAIGNRMINARAETVMDKPAFRRAFQQRRCLIPADGFFEWQKQKRQPYFIRMRDTRPFALAGLWEQWQAPGRELLQTCTIITTEGNELLRPIHPRMPVIVPPEHYNRWLDTTSTPDQVVSRIFQPYPPEHMEALPVGTRVNSPKNDDPACLEPLTEPPEEKGLF